MPRVPRGTVKGSMPQRGDIRVGSKAGVDSLQSAVMYTTSAMGSRRARSLPPNSTFSSGSLAALGTNRSTRFGPLRQGALNRAVKEATASISGSGRGRKTQRFPLGSGRRVNGLHKMDGTKKRIPDYTDIAYREAVSRLRYLLAESYNASPYRSLSQGYTRGDDSGGEDAVIERTRALLSPYRRPMYTARRTLFPSAARSPSRAYTSSAAAPSVHVEAPEIHTAPATPRATTSHAGPAASNESPPSGTLPPEMMAYIERQEEYIDQLERESQFCREELSGLLGKVKEVISENEGLQERQKTGVLRSVLDYLQPSDREDDDEDEDDTEASEAEPRRKKAVQRSQRRMEGPSIMYESRISELEAQLTQVRIDLKKSQDETESYKRRLLGEGLPLDASEHDTLRNQMENLKKERAELAETVGKLQSAVAQLRERESEATHRLKRAQEAAEQTQFERSQSEMEVRRLKEELDRLHGRLREAVAEQGRRAAEERGNVERRYQQQIEQLQSDLATQWDASSRLQLELEKQRRTEAELRRDLACKNATLDEMAKETQAKIDLLQGQLHASLAQHSALSQELAAAQLQADRAALEGRAESSRLEAEVSALRERLDRADSETLRARQEALRLSEQLAALDREMTLNKKKGESSTQQPPPGLREQELMTMVTNMQEKHVETVAELEGMIQSQNQVMAKLKDECHTLTQKLEESSTRHKDEMVGLQNNIDYLTSKLEASLEAQGQRELDTPTAHHYNTEVNGLEDTVYEGSASPNRGTYQSQQNIAEYMESSPTEGRAVVESSEQGRYSYKPPEQGNNYEISQRIGKFESPEGKYPAESMDTTAISRGPTTDDAERTRNYEQTPSAYQQTARTASRNQPEIARSSYELPDTTGTGGVETRRDYEPVYQRSPSRDIPTRESPQDTNQRRAGKFDTSETDYKRQEFESGYEVTTPVYERSSAQFGSPSKSTYQPTSPYIQQTGSPSTTSYQSPTYTQSESPSKGSYQPPYTQQSSYQSSSSYPQAPESPSKSSYTPTETYQSESPSKTSYQPTRNYTDSPTYPSAGPYSQQSDPPSKSSYEPYTQQPEYTSKPAYSSDVSYVQQLDSPSKSAYQSSNPYTQQSESVTKTDHQSTYSQQSESPSKLYAPNKPYTQPSDSNNKPIHQSVTPQSDVPKAGQQSSVTQQSSSSRSGTYDVTEKQQQRPPSAGNRTSSGHMRGRGGNHSSQQRSTEDRKQT